jgi:cell division septation protein DedD
MTSESPKTMPETGESRLPMTPTGLAGWLLCGVLAVGIGVCGVYLAVRVVSAKPAAPAAAVAPPAPTTPVKAAAVEPVAAAAAPAPVPAAVPVPAARNVTISADETRGRTFIQVGAIERDAAPGFIQKLAQHGFEGRIAEGPEDKIVRILVGPVAGEAISSTRAAVEKAGFGAFARSY